MIYIITISIIVSYICNIQVYKICNELNKNKYNTIIIYTSIITSIVLVYWKYGITVESIKYISLIPFIIIISIIDYHTTYIYDITVQSGIIIQGIIFFITINKDINSNSHIMGLMVGFIVPYIIVKMTKGLGLGDIGLYSLCCFVLGHNYSIYLISLSFVLGTIYCIYMILIKRNNIIKIPFAPFISLSAIIIMLTNNDILKIYFDIISK